MVGTHVLVTLIHGVPGAIFWGHSVPMFIENFLSVALAQAKMIKGEEKEKMTKKLVTLGRHMHAMRFIAPVVFMVIPYSTLISDDPDFHVLCSGAYYLANTLMGTYVAFYCARDQVKNLSDMLSESLKNAPSDNMQRTVEKLGVMHREITNNGFSNSLSCIAFLAFPLLYNLQAYQTAFGWTICPMISCVMYYTFKPKSESGSSRNATSNASVASVAEKA